MQPDLRVSCRSASEHAFVDRGTNNTMCASKPTEFAIAERSHGFRLMCLWLLVLSACGSRSQLRQELDSGPAEYLGREICNGRDDDGNRQVDEVFRDKRGRYVTDEHCGRCDQACTAQGPEILEAHCSLIAEKPTCAATRCAAGLAPTQSGGCAPRDTFLCLLCAQDDDCGPIEGARCVDVGGERRCGIDCELGCATGYTCGDDKLCVPTGGSCRCDPGQTFDLACAAQVPLTDTSNPVCVGRASCVNGTLSACSTSVEVCDEIDNDCDGQIDDGFLDERGVYSLDPANCGQCGASCLEDTQSELELVCGGDPFAPRCVLRCPDVANGIQPGDKLDGDQDLASGCECRVTSLSDEAGPLDTTGQALDLNCDGADGVVLESFYVAPDGDDTWAGSPTRPLRTLGAAMERARTSLTSDRPRPHVFVASGSYAETLSLVDGLSLHGGYRRDFRALDPEAFEVEIRAPLDSSSPGGAALIGTDVGVRSTRLEWVTLRGLDAGSEEAPTFGAYLVRPGTGLSLRGVTIHAGVPGRGATGRDGTAGKAPSAAAKAGTAPRAASEDAQHNCIASDDNRVGGGAAGTNTCSGVDVSGGEGGSAQCPSEGEQGPGRAGASASGTSTNGGRGGSDSVGPTLRGNGCRAEVCCGLADFRVPDGFHGPDGGQSGPNGAPGEAGRACADPLGSFVGTRWVTALGAPGKDGAAGAGGGGGGAGGGAAMEYFASLCPYADGLGGGGGGGGAGGCGGAGGSAGVSGPPSIALFLVEPESFSMQELTLAPASGGRGGAGGAGGDGGLGGAGAVGGALTAQQKTTPSLSGPFPGARGGRGGEGGAGGGGGGGCGGSSIGLWIDGKAPSILSVWQNRNRFTLGQGGVGGSGGGGTRVGGDGKRGEATHVVVR